MTRGGVRTPGEGKQLGRPPTGQRPQMKVVLEPEQERAVDQLAEKLGGQRQKAKAIRRILDVGIAALRAVGEIPPDTAPTKEGSER